MASPLSYKKNFKVSPALQLFYTGGPVVVSPDENFVACACTDDVKVVEIATGAVVKTFKGDTEPITAIVYSPDGKTLFAASRSLQIKHWDLGSDACLRSWKAHDAPVIAMAVDASGGLLATASADRRVLVWDTEGGFCTHAFKGHTGVASCVQFHPDIHRLLLFSGSDDGTVRVWDLVTKSCASVLDKHFSAVTSLSVSTNGWTLVSAGRDKVVNVWDLRDYSLHTTVPIYEAVETVLVVPDGCGLPGCTTETTRQKKSGQAPLKFLTVGERGIVQVWNSEGAACLYKQKLSDATVSSNKEDPRGGFIAAMWLPSQREIMCVTLDQRLLFYASDTLESGEKDLKLVKRLIGYNEEIIDLKFVGEDDRSLAVATNLEQGGEMGEEQGARFMAHLGAELPLGMESLVLPSEGKCVGLVIVDEVNGFCTVGAGNLAPTEQMDAVSEMVQRTDKLAKQFSDRNWPIIAFLDTHQKDKPECPYPPHCIVGTGEENLVPELEWLESDPHTTLMRKDCINGFVGGMREDGSNIVIDWIKDNKVQQILVVGICTDICVMDFVVTTLSARNHGIMKPLEDVFVYSEACATYHLPNDIAKNYEPPGFPHPQDITHYMGLYFAKSRGARVVNEVKIL